MVARADDADARLDRGRVELRPRVLLEPADRLACGQFLAVRPVGRHRVERVAAEDDARLDRDLLAGELVGVAGAVEVLVTVAYDRPHLLEPLDRRDDPLAEDGMLLDDRPLLRGQPSRL